ncbi:MAG: potassium channel family protein [Flavobacteriia bacterium]|jgi:voltage-gated potassium channel
MLNDFRFLNKIFFFIGLIIVGLSIGTFGYMLIEGWDFLDSLYMSVITTTTVGFMEVNQLSDAGRIFTMFLIFLSFGTFAYAVTSLSKYIIGGEYKESLFQYKFTKRLKKMEKHVIICGFGRVGKQVAEDLLNQKIPVIVLESSKDIVETIGKNRDFLMIHGDASQDETLHAAKISNARAIIACLPKDADNLYVVLASRELRKDLVIISRASNHNSVSKLKRAGANNVIMPDIIGGSHMASLVSSPDVMEFMENIQGQGIEAVNIESISFNELPAEFQNKTIKQLEAKRLTGVTIIGYKSPDGEYVINPDWETVVVKNSKLFVLGNSKQISEFVKIFQLNHH